MGLPDVDDEYLRERGLSYEVTVDSNMTCVVLHGWPLPAGYDRQSATLLIRLSPGYPDVPPDMWWFDPAIHLANGQNARAADVMEQHLGRSWQRWSRHFTNGQWRSGIDGVESFLALISLELERSVGDQAR